MLQTGGWTDNLPRHNRGKKEVVATVPSRSQLQVQFSVIQVIVPVQVQFSQVQIQCVLAKYKH